MGWAEAATKLNGKAQYRTEAYPLRLDDGSFAEWMGIGNYAGKAVSESTALGFSAVYRAVNIIAGTIAGLPLKSYRNEPDGTRKRVETWVDDIGAAVGMTPFEFKELLLVHELLHGNFYGVNIYNGAGAVAGLQPIHPLAVTVKAVETEQEKERFPGFMKFFEIALKDDKSREFSPADLTHVPGMGTDGLKGLSPITVHRNAISTGLAGDEAAGRLFSNGMLVGGLVTPAPNEDVSEDEAKVIMAHVKAKTTGVKNAGDIAFVNKVLQFHPWAINPEDAQFIQSRSFQIEEVARIFGVPPHLLAQTEKQTSWGTGVSEQNLGLSKYTLMAWTTRIEERISRLLPNKQFVEFDYKGLFQGTPEQEIKLLLEQVKEGLITVNEARAVINLPPLGGSQPSTEETE